MKQKKTKLTFIFAALLLSAVVFTACNNSSSDKPATTETPAATKDSTPAPAPAPALDDSMMKGNTKPTPEKPAPPPAQ